MTPDTFRDAISEFTRPGNWKTFVIELHSGVRYIIPHPEAIRIHGELIRYDGTEQYADFFDASSVIRVLGSLDPPGGILDDQWGNGNESPD